VQGVGCRVQGSGCSASRCRGASWILYEKSFNLKLSGDENYYTALSEKAFESKLSGNEVYCTNSFIVFVVQETLSPESFNLKDFSYRVQGAGFRVQGAGFMVQGAGAGALAS
jgi:hypothetical protein